MRVLVTGGSGYIGSHMVRKLLKEDYEVTVLDNFSNSTDLNLETIKKNSLKKLKVIKGDVLTDLGKIKDKIDAVIHFAALKSVPDSVKNPIKYYHNNTGGVVRLLDWMAKERVKNLIFSSTAAVYGNILQTPVSENVTPNPTSPYGASKLFAERIIQDSAKAENLNAVILRYFNVGGNEELGSIGDEDRDPKALIPALITSHLGWSDSEFSIFGNDFDTRDGFAIRDFVHVLDLVEAHWLALNKLVSKQITGVEIVNIGSEKGLSIKEIIDGFEDTVGTKIKYSIKPRRDGDIGVSIASSEKAKRLLGWSPKYGLREVLSSSWEWYKKYTSTLKRQDKF